MTRRTFIVWMIWTAAWLCLTGSAWAQPSDAVNPHGVPYLSGGVGLDEQAAMDALAGQYNLKLVFAQAGGNYLGDVRVNLQGPANLSAFSGGPWFLVNLPPGSYRVTADYNGAVKTQVVTVEGGAQKTVVFRW